MPLEDINPHNTTPSLKAMSHRPRFPVIVPAIVALALLLGNPLSAGGNSAEQPAEQPTENSGGNLFMDGKAHAGGKPELHTVTADNANSGARSATISGPAPAGAYEFAARRMVDLYRIPEPDQSVLKKIPKNLARWHMGANLIIVDNENDDPRLLRVQIPDAGSFAESILLSDNAALTFDIKQGNHDFIIDFGRFATLSRAVLNNKDAAGQFELFSSDRLAAPKSRKWDRVSQPVSFNSGEIPEARFPETETRFLLVRFQIRQPGQIGNFTATGSADITRADFSLGKGDDVSEVSKPQPVALDYDFAASYTGSRVAFVSGGPLDRVFNLVDEDPSTSYRFPADDEAIIILDMRKETQMKAFAASYTAKESGRIQVYMVNTLPDSFTNGQASGVATLVGEQGNVFRPLLAAGGTGPGDSRFGAFMANQTPRDVVRVPENYFKEIEDSYSAEVDVNEDRTFKIMDELKRRYVIFRFLPDSAREQTPEARTALFRPGGNPEFTGRRARDSDGGITFRQIQAIGEVSYDDVLLTMDEPPPQPLQQPPENPPEDPPVLSE